ncbi:right-handed parallel beta-helix repeat-containing protein [Azonexus hydrophilus]|uniref:Right-handed parallel beta-helix repeat-containing protein n=1 Tax=Azonexus hydrophilus TaxID=418702 RepID=A0ABZ2XEE8_9RHOO
MFILSYVRPYLLRLLLVVGVFYSNISVAVDFYIQEDGCDCYDGLHSTHILGTNSGPLASVFGIRSAIEKYRANELVASNEEVVVNVGQGDFYFDKEFVVNEQLIGGWAGFKIRAQAGAAPRFIGGLRKSGFELVREGLFKISGLSGIDEVERIYVNGAPAVRARYPNYGNELLVQAYPKNIDKNSALRRSELYLDSDAAQFLAKLNFFEEKIDLFARHSWEISINRVRQFLPSDGRVILGNAARWPFLHFGKRQLVYLENSFAFLDAPGEFYFDEFSKDLFYVPRIGEVERDLEVIVPLVDRLIVFEGSAGNKLNNVGIDGIFFGYTRGVSRGLYDEPQAAVGLPAVIEASHVESLAISNCVFENYGAYGVWFKKGVVGSKVEGNVFSSGDGGAIKIGWYHDVASDADYTQSNLIYDNNIFNIGLRYHGAVAIWIGQSGYNVVFNNRINDTSYTGISVGWRWGYGSSLAKGNIIIRNSLEGVGGGLLSDLAAIYLLGPSPGTQVVGNYIYRVSASDGYGPGAWGIYADQGASDIIIDNNFISEAANGCFHLHYGRNNLLVNNFFYFCGYSGQLKQTRFEDHESFLFLNNIVVWDCGPLYSGRLGGSFSGNFFSKNDCLLAEDVQYSNNGRNYGFDFQIHHGVGLYLDGNSVYLRDRFIGEIPEVGFDFSYVGSFH